MCGYLPLSCSVLIFFINSFVYKLCFLLGCDIELHLLLLTGELLLFYLSQGTVCDVRDGKDVKALVEFARDKLKHIDLWVCIDSFPHKITACSLIFTVVLSGIETWNHLQ